MIPIRRHIWVAAFCFACLAAGCLSLSSCAEAGPNTAHEPSLSEKAEQENAPENLSYLLVKVVSKNASAETLHVEVLDPSPLPSTIAKGTIPAGTVGDLDCSDLISKTSLIKEGATWVVSYEETGQTALPITLYSIQTLENLAEHAAANAGV